MADKILSDLKSASLSGITDDQGNSLISPNTDGEQAYIFGDTAMREIQAGVANGDFAVPPPDATGTISADNELPYWTFTDSSAGEISAALVADPSTASGNLLTWSIDGGASTGNSATLRRYVRVAGNANRNTAYQGEIFAITGTGATSDRQRVRATLSIESVDADYLPLTASSSRFDVANNLNDKSLSTGWITPDAEAAFLLITITINIPTLSPAALVTLPITEVRLNSGTSIVSFPNATDPTNSTWIISAANETGGSDSQLLISNYDDLTGTYPSMSLIKGASNASIEINANDGGTIELTTGVGGLLKHTGDEVTFDNSSPLSGGVFTVNMNGSSGGIGTIDLAGTTEIVGTTTVTTTTSGDGTVRAGALRAQATTTSDLLLSANGSDLIFQDTNAANGTNPRLLFRQLDGTYNVGIKSGAPNVVQILNATSATDYAQLWAERIYPMNGSTASRYIFDNGTQTAFSGAVLAGTLTSTGVVTGTNFTGTTITTTTATANNAVWVLTAGTTYNLRRFTSSQRYKTNIVDADEVVLEAVKKIRPRHFTSLLEDENGATRLGFIAEEIEAAGLTHAIGYDEEGQVETIDTTALLAALFAHVNDLEARLAALEGA